MSHKPYTIALVQMKMAERPAANMKHAVEQVEKAAKKGARVICLPELFRAPYFCQTEDAAMFDLAEPVPGPSTALLAKVAKKHKVVLVASLFERRAAGLYHNTTAVLDADGSLAGIYRKMHIPDDPCYYEKFYFTPGDLGFKVFDTAAGRIGVLICWDQWYPEAARLTAMQGADVIFYPTAIGWHPREKAQHGAAQLEAWKTVQRGHAVANGVYVASVNRIGLEKPAPSAAGLQFWGSSFIADPQGGLVSSGSVDREEILFAEVDPARIEDVRRNWPFLRDRRIDAYGDLTRRYVD